MFNRLSLSGIIFLVIILAGFVMIPTNAGATTTTVQCEVLVVGGGAGGICSAIQSARLGADTILVEETPWFGGMLTAAGVSATDGNHFLPTGLWGEFRQHLYDYYGGPSAVNTGWVSYTLFEPHVGNDIFHQMADAEPKLSYFHGYWPMRVLKQGNKVTGGVFINDTGNYLVVRAAVSVAADECGDFMALAGVPYRIGMEAQWETGESAANPVATDIIQDLTYVAILKDFGDGADKTIPQPPGYDPAKYDCTCHEVCEGTGSRHSCDQMFKYGRLPNDKMMINWPVNGNDYYLNVLEMSHQERIQALQAAKDHTLGWVYFMQTVGGYKHYGIATDEYPTPDNFPFIPYHRESRRMVGLVRFRLQDILDPYNTPSGDLYKTGIAVGDYAIDHHHGNAPEPYHESFPKIPSFAVPYGALLPSETDGLLLAEKSISVTHVVNGCTRLQPCVMSIGQAAGAAAALSVLGKTNPRDISLRELQQTLLDADCWCLPFIDAPPERWSFQAVQRVALAGALKGTGIPQGWANKTCFYPEEAVTRAVLGEALAVCLSLDEPPELGLNLDDDAPSSRAVAALAVYESLGSPAPDKTDPYYSDVAPGAIAFQAVQYGYEKGWFTNWAEPPDFLPESIITREEFAALLDVAFDPFNSLPVEIDPPPRIQEYVLVLSPLWKRHADPDVPNLTSKAPDWFPSSEDNNRCMAFNPKTDHLLITDNNANTLHIVDADTGADLGVMDNSILTGGLLDLASVAVDADGVIYAAPYNQNPFKVYRWENEGSVPTVAFSASLDYYCGRAMDITGTKSSTRLNIGASGEQGRFLILSTKNGSDFAIEQWVTGGATETPFGLYGITAPSENQVLAKSRFSGLFRYIKDGGSWQLDTGFKTIGFDGTITSALGAWPEKDLFLALAFDAFSSVNEKGVPVVNTGGIVYREGKEGGYQPIALAPVEESFASGNGAGAVAIDPAKKRLFVSFSRNGFAAFGLDFLEPEPNMGWVFY